MKSYPLGGSIWPGTILGTIVKSVATAMHPEYDTLQSWSGNTYVVQGSDGRYGAITFHGPQGHLFEGGKGSYPVYLPYLSLKRSCLSPVRLVLHSCRRVLEGLLFAHALIGLSRRAILSPATEGAGA